jgi:hypothetical protein
LETVYRRLTERIATAAGSTGAFRSIIDTWFYALEEDVLSSGKVDANDQAALVAATNELMEQRLDSISRTARGFAAALRGYRTAQANGDNATAEGLIAWVAGQPNVSATIKRAADLKGDVDHFAALSFLQGLLVVLRDSGHPGLLVVLDEVRERLGKPITLTSTYRSPAYNQAVGGARFSQHLVFNATDIQAKGAKPAEVAELAKGLRGKKFKNPLTGKPFTFKGGIGRYATFVHIDTRGHNADW